MDISPTTPRLTDLPGEKHPFICQSCGGSAQPGLGNGLLRLTVNRWQEHDHHDKPEKKIVVLCNVCEKRLIKPHPRLYEQLHKNQPWPGSMAICLDCKFRDGIACSHPNAQANGGPGVMITIAKPIHALVDGTNYSGPLTMWPRSADGCREKEVGK